MSNIAEGPPSGQQTTKARRTTTTVRFPDAATLPAVIRPYVETWALDRDKVDLIKRTVCPPDTTDDELALYLHECQRRGVHPLDRAVVMTKREDRHNPGQKRVVFMTTIAYKRARAEETGKYAGSDDVEYGPAAKDGAPAWAKTTVWKLVEGHRCGFTATVRWQEYYPGRGSTSFMWDRMQFNQLGKCAESKALDKAFPQRLGGLPIQEELDAPDGNGRAPIITPPPEPPAGQLAAATGVFEAADADEDDDEDVPETDCWKVDQLTPGYVPGTNRKKAMWQLDAVNGAGDRVTVFTTDTKVAAQLEQLRDQDREFMLTWEARDNYDAISTVSPLS